MQEGGYVTALVHCFLSSCPCPLTVANQAYTALTSLTQVQSQPLALGHLPCTSCFLPWGSQSLWWDRSGKLSSAHALTARHCGKAKWAEMTLTGKGRKLGDSDSFCYGLGTVLRSTAHSSSGPRERLPSEHTGFLRLSLFTFPAFLRSHCQIHHLHRNPYSGLCLQTKAQLGP